LGQKIASFTSKAKCSDDLDQPDLGAKIICDLDTLMLRPGRYRINAIVYGNGEIQDYIEGAHYFEVEPGQFRGRPIDQGDSYGSVFMPHRWHLPS
jgi:lipopolysaccharide transport system ATP-binding protein